LSKINDHFNQNNCDAICEEEKQSDTAYNSAVCSENSSLERKPHQDVHSVSDNLVELFLLTCEYNAPVISPGTWETLIEL
jgi:hypothetical protein